VRIGLRKKGFGDFDWKFLLFLAVFGAENFLMSMSWVLFLWDDGQDGDVCAENLLMSMS